MNTHLNLDTAITAYTLADLAKYSSMPAQMMSHECHATVDGPLLPLFHSPGRVDAYLIGVCTAGEAVVSINMQEYTLKPGTLFTLAPGHLFQIHEMEQARAHMLNVSSSFFARIHVDTKQLMPLSVLVGKPCLPIDAENQAIFADCIRALSRELNFTQTAFTNDLIASMISTTIYKVGDIIHRGLHLAPQVGAPGNRAEDYFKQFIDLLAIYFIRERTVSFYADKLNITPKYLTTLIKRVSGRSVSEWIDSYVIVEAKMMLKFSDRSIQEIASELNFANQSFFGSYFRRNTGMSPSQYRAKN